MFDSFINTSTNFMTLLRVYIFGYIVQYVYENFHDNIIVCVDRRKEFQKTRHHNFLTKIERLDGIIFINSTTIVT